MWPGIAAGLRALGEGNAWGAGSPVSPIPGPLHRGVSTVIGSAKGQGDQNTGNRTGSGLLNLSAIGA